MKSSNSFQCIPVSCFNAIAIGKGLDNVKKLYASKGYVHFGAIPRPQFDEIRHTVALILDIREGEATRSQHVFRLEVEGDPEASILANGAILRCLKEHLWQKLFVDHPVDLGNRDACRDGCLTGGQILDSGFYRAPSRSLAEFISSGRTITICRPYVAQGSEEC